jgi:hypothetical protein
VLHPEFVAAVRTLASLLFLSAAIAKVRHWPVFEGVVANYRVLPEFLVRPFSYLLPPLEFALAGALLLGVAGAEYAAAALLLLFVLAMGINLLRGRAHIDCGCFSSALKQELRWALVVRNAVLAALLGAAAGGALSEFDSSVALGVLGGIAAFFVLQSLNAILAMPIRARRGGHA